MLKRFTYVFLLLLIFTGTLSAKGQAQVDPYKNGLSLEQPGLYAKFLTDKGTLIFKLDHQNAPLTVLNFINNVEKGTYENLPYFKHIKNYSIFSGNPSSVDPTDEDYSFPIEINNSLSHSKAGILSMDGLSGMSSKTRFFMTLSPDPVLDDKYSAFGELMEGYSVLAKLQRDDLINSVEIVRTGAEAEAFKTDSEEFNRLSKVALDTQLESFREKYPDVISAIDSLGEGVQKSLTGIYYKVYREGSGRMPQPEDTVSVHYTAMLLDGTIFDSSVSRGTAFEFQVGTQSVITGWDETLMSMSEGEQRTVVIPPNLAYGDVQAGPIPPNSWLLFQIELLEVK